MKLSPPANTHLITQCISQFSPNGYVYYVHVYTFKYKIVPSS